MMEKSALSQCRLEQCRMEGHRVLIMENELTRIAIDVDQGAHIVEITDKSMNINVLYNDPKGIAAYDIGGWYELFPNVGKKCDFNGVDIPAHGDVQHLPWEFHILKETKETIRVSLWTESHVRPFRIEKTLSIGRYKPCLFITEKITNTSTVPEPYLWGHHVTFGAPFISPACRIDLPQCRVFKRPEYHSDKSRIAPEASGTLDAMPGQLGSDLDIRYFPVEQCNEMLFMDGLHSHWFNVFHELFKLGLAMAWDGTVFPYLWLWQENHASLHAPFLGNVYGMALEPQTSNVPILNKAVMENQAPVLLGGQSTKTWLTMVLHHTSEKVQSVTKEGDIYSSVY